MVRSEEAGLETDDAGGRSERSETCTSHDFRMIRERKKRLKKDQMVREASELAEEVSLAAETLGRGRRAPFLEELRERLARFFSLLTGSYVNELVTESVAKDGTKVVRADRFPGHIPPINGVYSPLEQILYTCLGSSIDVLNSAIGLRAFDTDTGDGLGLMLPDIKWAPPPPIKWPVETTSLLELASCFRRIAQQPDHKWLNGGKSLSRRGRPRRSDSEHDAKIREAWQTGRHKTKADLAREMGMTSEQVRQALERDRKRKAKRRNLD